MLLGIVADVHEEADALRRALDAFRQCGVDQVVTLGDTCDVMFRESRAAEVVGLMRDAGATGVWGNHDYSLCREISEPCRQRYSPEVLDFMAGMQGHLAIGDCLFSHVEPWLDPHDPMQLWYYEGLPDTDEKLQRTFDAVAQRFMFIGHFHRWLAMTPAGPVDWDGNRPILLDGDTRYLIAVGAVVDGHCGTFDTDRHVLTPLRV